VRSLVKLAGGDLALGNLLLTDQEATKLVIRGIRFTSVPRLKWPMLGKVRSPRKLIIRALERAMQRAEVCTYWHNSRI
jgi:hypothetical protein